MIGIVTVVIEEMPKFSTPKETGVDIFGRTSTDKMSKHKSLLITGYNIEGIEFLALEFIRRKGYKGRVSRIEIIGE